MLYPQRSSEVRILASENFQNAIALELRTDHDVQNEARGGDPVRGVSVDRAMDILDELEKDDEYDEDEESGAAEEGKPKVTDDKQDSKDKTSPEAGGAQDDKEKAAKEEHGS